MFDILRKFFRRLFRKKKPFPVEPEIVKAKLAQPELPPPKPEKEPPDFQDELRKAAEEKLARRRERRAEKKTKTEKKETGQQVSRQGIPILSENDSFPQLFNLEKDKEPKKEIQEEPDENFAEMLEFTLSEKHMKHFLQEKRGAFQDRPLPVSEEIKSYPPPEDEIDLHGYTAREAERKIESFIRTARWNGKLTLRVIMGRGTHSRGRAVLPDVVETKVVYLKKRGLVRTFKWENHGKLKSGSVIVYLA